jgi:hypothetical protein
VCTPRSPTASTPPSSTPPSGTPPRHLEHELDLPFDDTVATLNEAIGGWHLALWRIFDSPYHLAPCRSSDVVLAPVTVTPRRQPAPPL